VVGTRFASRVRGGIVSFYMAFTVPGHCLLAADNRRRIFGLGGTAFERPVTGRDANKLRSIGRGFWSTGVGWTRFQAECDALLRARFERLPEVSQPGLSQLKQVFPDPEDIFRMHRETVSALTAAARELGTVSLDVEAVGCDLLVAGVAAGGLPVLARWSFEDRFRLHIHEGPGFLAAAPLGIMEYDAGEAGVWKRRLEGLLGVLAAAEPARLLDTALQIIPPVMEGLARWRPERMSASGDLVLIGPWGSERHLF